MSLQSALPAHLPTSKTARRGLVRTHGIYAVCRRDSSGIARALGYGVCPIWRGRSAAIGQRTLGSPPTFLSLSGALRRLLFISSHASGQFWGNPLAGFLGVNMNHTHASGRCFILADCSSRCPPDPSFARLRSNHPLPDQTRIAVVTEPSRVNTIVDRLDELAIGSDAQPDSMRHGGNRGIACRPVSNTGRGGKRTGPTDRQDGRSGSTAIS